MPFVLDVNGFGARIAQRDLTPAEPEVVFSHEQPTQLMVKLMTKSHKRNLHSKYKTAYRIKNPSALRQCLPTGARHAARPGERLHLRRLARASRGG